ncbi:MAG: GntR family transcriptional regulator [Lachnospiraceae bacterium]|nr:MAG: GntR family transcriptional regulator [Lachnospiraceae bacterium]
MYRYKLVGQNDKPVYELLYEYIRNDILTGKLVSGDRLPSKRNMASDNNISVTTVVNAYNQLLMEGYIKSFEKKGYFVSDISALPRVKKKNLYENP